MDMPVYARMTFSDSVMGKAYIPSDFAAADLEKIRRMDHIAGKKLSACRLPFRQ
jgi:hypothetical protein